MFCYLSFCNLPPSRSPSLCNLTPPFPSLVFFWQTGGLLSLVDQLRLLKLGLLHNRYIGNVASGYISESVGVVFVVSMVAIAMLCFKEQLKPQTAYRKPEKAQQSTFLLLLKPVITLSVLSMLVMCMAFAPGSLRASTTQAHNPHNEIKVATKAHNEMKQADNTNVVLLSLESVRAKSLSMYQKSYQNGNIDGKNKGPPNPIAHTPHLASMAANGRVVSQAYTHTPNTLKSILNIYCGFGAKQDLGWDEYTDGTLPLGLCLPATLQERGYRTSVFTPGRLAGHVISPEIQKRMGFDTVFSFENLANSANSNSNAKDKAGTKDSDSNELHFGQQQRWNFTENANGMGATEADILAPSLEWVDSAMQVH